MEGGSREEVGGDGQTEAGLARGLLGNTSKDGTHRSRAGRTLLGSTVKEGRAEAEQTEACWAARAKEGASSSGAETLVPLTELKTGREEGRWRAPGGHVGM